MFLFLCVNHSDWCDQVERLQQKLQIMTEMYQENELKLHRSVFINIAYRNF